MAKSQNPMDVFRREQKKKELKKNRTERQRDKRDKLATMDTEELRTKLKTLERQAQMNPTDGPTRKRKQELEDTLNAALKKQKEVETEQKQQAADETVASKEPKSFQDINEANKERYQNPENSVYYHPTLNPFGVPPPGRPQMYHVAPPAPQPRAPRLQQPRDRPMRGGRGGGGNGPRFHDRRGSAPPPPPPPGAEAFAGEDDDEGDGGVNSAGHRAQQFAGSRGFSDDEADEDREEKQAQLRSLVPVALRVPRRATSSLSSAPRPAHRAIAAPMNPVPRPASLMAPVFPGPGGPRHPPGSASALAAESTDAAAQSVASASEGSVSKEYDAFMEEMKSLGAL